MTYLKLKNNPSYLRMANMPSFIPEFFHDFVNESIFPRGSFKSVPAVNISEDDKQFHVALAVPGMNKSDFKITVEDGVLNIKAETKNEQTTEDKKFSRKEFNYSSFTRSFTMPEQVLAENIVAEYVDGVLNISIPKAVEMKKDAAREIAIS